MKGPDKLKQRHIHRAAVNDTPLDCGQKAGVRFVAADMPEANEMVVGIVAVVAQARPRRDIAPITADLKAEGGLSLRQLATGLNERGIPTARGGIWSAVQVMRAIQ